MVVVWRLCVDAVASVWWALLWLCVHVGGWVGGWVWVWVCCVCCVCVCVCVCVLLDVSASEPLLLV